MGIARRKWKIEQQAGKAESSYFKKWSLIWREQFLPAKFAHAFLQARAMQQVWTCLCLSWQQHGGKAAVQVLRDGTNPSGRCQFCSSLLYMEKQKVSVSPAVVLQPDGLSSCSSHPCVFLGCTAPFSIMSIKTDTPHSWALLPWASVRLCSPQVSSKSEAKHVKTT